MDADLRAAALHAIRVDRQTLFGHDDREMPISAPEHVSVPQIGFIGPDYHCGGTLLLGINPGGGRDTYRKTAADEVLLPMIQRLGDGDSGAQLDSIFDQYATNMRGWNLWRIVAPVIDACSASQSEIAYLNWCPFRTRADKMPRAETMRRSRDRYLAPLIHDLAPGRIIALGRKVGGWLQKDGFGVARCHVIERTIGDTRLSKNAVETLEALRRSAPGDPP